MVTQAIKQINISDIIGKHITLTKSGSRLIGLCPFHQEKTPSFFVFKERFKCFGCGESGDVVDFIQKLNGCSFQDALKHLGIKSGYIDKRVIERRNYEKVLNSNFQEWCINADTVLARSIIQIREILHDIKTEQDLDDFGGLFHKFNLYKYWRDIIHSGADKDKFTLYKKYKWLGGLL